MDFFKNWPKIRDKHVQRRQTEHLTGELEAWRDTALGLADEVKALTHIQEQIVTFLRIENDHETAVRGLFRSLTDEQQRRVLDYDGPVGSGVSEIKDQ